MEYRPTSPTLSVDFDPVGEFVQCEPRQLEHVIEMASSATDVRSYCIVARLDAAMKEFVDGINALGSGPRTEAEKDPSFPALCTSISRAALTIGGSGTQILIGRSNDGSTLLIVFAGPAITSCSARVATVPHA